MAFGDLTNLERELGNPRELTWSRLDADDRRQLVAQGTGVDLGAVPDDDSGPLKALDAFGHRGRGQIDAPAELGERDATVGCELADDLTVGGIDLPEFVGIFAHEPVLSGVGPP